MGFKGMVEARSIARKVFHFSSVSIPLCYLFIGRMAALVFSLVLFALSACFELFRIGGRLNISFVTKYMQVKDSESRKPTGSFYYLLAIPVTILVFQKSVAVSSLFIAAIADPLCSLAGLKWGKTKIFEKSLEGSSIFFVASLLILSFFPFPTHVRLITAFVATLIELFTPKWLDDNLTIPIGTALVLTFLT